MADRGAASAAVGRSRRAASPTQPFPTRPAPFEYQGATEDDLVDFTPAFAPRPSRRSKRFRLGPLFTPPSLQGTVQRPGTVGGANWGGAAVDPETGILYVPSRNGFSVTTLAEPDERLDSNLQYIQVPAAAVRACRAACRSSSRPIRASPPST